MTPHFWIVVGGSGTMSCSIRWQRWSQLSRALTRRASCPLGAAVAMASLREGMAWSARRSITTSRGVMRRQAILPTRRSMSPTCLRRSVTCAVREGLAMNSATASCRCRMALTLRRGITSHRLRRREPMGVVERSSMSASELESPRPSLKISRLRMENLSSHT